MNKINFDFFAFFGAVLPGIPIFIILCFLINGLSFSLEVVIYYLKIASLSEMSFSIVICYLIGFCFHHPSYEIFKPILKCFWAKRAGSHEVSIGKREKELVAIRHNSHENFKIINTFLALRQMAYSMFFSLIVFVVFLVISKLIYGDWALNDGWLMLVTLIFSFLFLRRAVAFHEFVQRMISNTYDLVKP